MPTWVYFFLVFVALIVFMSVVVHERTKRIAASREGENFDTFRSSFDADEVPQDVLLAVYAKFQEWCSGAVAEFPVRGTDHILAVYGMADEDLDDAIVEVIAMTGRRLPPEVQLRRMGPVIIVKDFAFFVAECPKGV